MSQSYIYIIGPKLGPYKIGISINPDQRLKNLQTGNKDTLYIHHIEECDESEYKLLEKFIHKELSYKRIKGEWFNLSLDQAILEVKFAIIRYSKF